MLCAVKMYIAVSSRGLFYIIGNVVEILRYTYIFTNQFLSYFTDGRYTISAIIISTAVVDRLIG